MQADYFLGVKLTPIMKTALDEIVKHAVAQSPLLPPNQSDVIRQMIADNHTRLNHQECRCDHCHQSIPSGEGEMLT